MSIRSLHVPADDNRVYANTQNGVYVSADRGHSWENRIEGLPRRYGTTIAVHPTDPDLLIATVQNGPRGGGAWLCRSENTVAQRGLQLNDQLTESTDRISTGCISLSHPMEQRGQLSERRFTSGRTELQIGGSVLDSTRIRWSVPATVRRVLSVPSP